MSASAAATSARAEAGRRTPSRASIPGPRSLAPDSARQSADAAIRPRRAPPLQESHVPWRRDRCGALLLAARSLYQPSSRSRTSRSSCRVPYDRASLRASRAVGWAFDVRSRFLSSPISSWRDPSTSYSTTRRAPPVQTCDRALEITAEPPSSRLDARSLLCRPRVDPPPRRPAVAAFNTTFTAPDAAMSRTPLPAERSRCQERARTRPGCAHRSSGFRSAAGIARRATDVVLVETLERGPVAGLGAAHEIAHLHGASSRGRGNSIIREMPPALPGFERGGHPSYTAPLPW